METMANAPSVSKEVPSLSVDEEGHSVALILQLPVEVLVHIFSFVDSVSLKRSERVCRLWKDVVRSPAVCSVMWIDIGLEWPRLLGVDAENPTEFLSKVMSGLTQKIIFTACYGWEKAVSVDRRLELHDGTYVWRKDTIYVWELLDYQSQAGKSLRRICLGNVWMDWHSLVTASIWTKTNRCNWTLEATNVTLTGVCSSISIGGAPTERSLLGASFSVHFDQVKVEFRAGESLEEVGNKLWDAIDARCVVPSEEVALLEKYWGEKAKSETCEILRIREPLYRDGVKDLVTVNWQTLRPSTVRLISAAVRRPWR